MNNKLDYITRQLSRSRKKRFEHYVINRIWHLLDDLDIKFTTQQYVSRPNGRALTDMFFPQFGLHIEVDEPFHLNQKEQDKHRQADIINATGHTVERIDTSKGILILNNRIDEIVKVIKNEKQKKLFKPWDLEREQDPKTYIEAGYIDITDNVAFKYSYLACNCFGHNYKGFQKGGTIHPFEPNKILWFPKLYPNEHWNNTISQDELTITEISSDTQFLKKHISESLNNGYDNRIVFARVKSPLGDVMYRFKGEYKLDKLKSNNQNGLIWKRIKTKVETYETHANKT